MTNKSIDSLLDFLKNSPTAWHAVEESSQLLRQADFIELKENDTWELKPHGRYFVSKNGSSLCAFITPSKAPEGLQMIGAHTDSPGFKLKPNAEFRKENMLLLGLEMYGSPLLSSWLNRDLGLAGRVVYLDKKGKCQEALVCLDHNPVVIPQLAIHLDRQVNEAGPILNKQEHLAALAMLIEGDKPVDFLKRAIGEQVDFKELLSTELFLFPLEPPAYVGYKQQMISGYRIDNLLSVHAALIGLMQTAQKKSDQLRLITLWDHEEIGSETAQGAGSPFLLHTLERITLSLKMSRDAYLQLLSNSLCLSVDLAHAQHPNYNDRHEPRHPVLMQKGIAVKFNAQQRYATNAVSAGRVAELCRHLSIPFQSFVTRSDIPCGTTIGPIHASRTGIPTVDIGIPQLSMHSCRELAACQDYEYMLQLLKAFLS